MIGCATGIHERQRMHTSDHGTGISNGYHGGIFTHPESRATDTVSSSRVLVGEHPSELLPPLSPQCGVCVNFLHGLGV